MIDRRPTIGDLADELLEPYGPFDNEHIPTLFEETESWESPVLGPDGEPIVYTTQRQKLGFNLTPRKKDTT